MTNVKNIHGTFDNEPPKGYTSWKAWWEAKKGRSFGTCSREGCTKNAEVGAHVIKADPGTSNEWYIVPLCRADNNSEDEFNVRDNDFEPVNP